MELPDPDSLRCFLEAAERLNFRAAAQACFLTPAALSKRIAQLERQLGVQLFERTTRRVSLTEAGRALVPRAEAALAQLAECARAARGEGGPTPLELVIGTRHELGLSWLVPATTPLERALPHLRVHLYFSSGPDLELRLRAGEIDCAVSSRRNQDPALEALRLHREDYAFVAHPKLLEREPFERPEDAARHVLIDAHRTLPLFGYWRGASGGQPLGFGGVRIMGTIAAIRWLVLRRKGVAVLPRYQVRPDLARGRLVELFPEVEALADHFRLLFRAGDARRGVFEQVAGVLRELPLK